MTNEAVERDPNMELVERTISYYDDPLQVLPADGAAGGGGGEDRVRIPMVTEPRCKVCMHPQRIFIENACFQGYPRRYIVERLDDPESLVWWNIKDHFLNGHVPIHKQAVIDTIWKRAIDDGITPEEYEANAPSGVQAVDLLVNKFLNRLKDPYYQPDIREGLAGIKMQREMEQEVSGAFDANDMYVALSLFMSHTRTVLTRYVPGELNDAMADLQRLLASDPVLKRISEKFSQEEETVGMLDREDEIIEGVEVLPPISTTREPIQYVPLDEGEPFDEPEDE